MNFQLERGEAVLFNNYAGLHNRTAFEDHDEPHLKRHLMRLWLIIERAGRLAEDWRQT